MILVRSLKKIQLFLVDKGFLTVNYFIKLANVFSKMEKGGLEGLLNH